MNLKTMLLTSMLFTTLACAQEEKKNPCLDKEMMQKALSEISKNDLNWFITGAIKIGLLGDRLKKRVYFMEKISQLTPEEQQQKIEKWLSNESRKTKMLERCRKISEFCINKKLDDESLEALEQLQKEINEEDSVKNEFLCQACGELTLPKDEELTQEDKKFFHTLQKKSYFYQLKKREALKAEARKKELEELEQKALNDFETLSDFLDYDNWNNRRAH